MNSYSTLEMLFVRVPPEQTMGVIGLNRIFRNYWLRIIFIVNFILMK